MVLEPEGIGDGEVMRVDGDVAVQKVGRSPSGILEWGIDKEFQRILPGQGDLRPQGIGNLDGAGGGLGNVVAAVGEIVGKDVDTGGHDVDLPYPSQATFQDGTVTSLSHGTGIGVRTVACGFDGLESIAIHDNERKVGVGGDNDSASGFGDISCAVGDPVPDVMGARLTGIHTDIAEATILKAILAVQGGRDGIPLFFRDDTIVDQEFRYFRLGHLILGTPAAQLDLVGLVIGIVGVCVIGCTLDSIHPKVRFVLVIDIPHVDVPIRVEPTLITNPSPFSHKLGHSAAMVAKDEVPGPGRNDSLIVPARVPRDGDHCEVLQVGLEVLGRPDQVIAIKVDDGAAIRARGQPSRITKCIVGMVAMPGYIGPGGD